jgi:hypothetical protein
MKALPAIRTIKSTNVNLADELEAGGAFLGGIVFIDTNHNIPKYPSDRA